MTRPRKTAATYGAQQLQQVRNKINREFGKVILEPKPSPGPTLFNGKKLDAAIREINLKKLKGDK